MPSTHAPISGKQKCDEEAGTKRFENNCPQHSPALNLASVPRLKPVQTN